MLAQTHLRIPEPDFRSMVLNDADGIKTAEVYATAEAMAADGKIAESEEFICRNLPEDAFRARFLKSGVEVKLWNDGNRGQSVSRENLSLLMKDGPEKDAFLSPWVKEYRAEKVYEWVKQFQLPPVLDLGIDFGLPDLYDGFVGSKSVLQGDWITDFKDAEGFFYEPTCDFVRCLPRFRASPTAEDKFSLTHWYRFGITIIESHPDLTERLTIKHEF